MKKYLAILIVSIISLFAAKASAYTPPAKPDNGWYIVDQAGKLSEVQLKQLNSNLDSISKSTSNEYGALIVPSLNGESIEEVAQSTFRSWGIGKKDLNNGVLVVIAVSDRKSRIHTGKGIEGDLPDLLCNDILRKNLNPHLKTGDFYGGLNETFNTITATISSRSLKPLPIKNADPVILPIKNSSESGSFVIVFFSVCFLSGGLAWYLIMSNNKREREDRRRQQAYDDAIKRRVYEKSAIELKDRLHKEDLANRGIALAKELARQKKVEAARIISDKASKEEDEYNRKVKDMHNHSHSIITPAIKPPRVIKPIISVGRVHNTSWAEKPQAIIPANKVATSSDKLKKDQDARDRAAKMAREAEEDSRRSSTRRRQEEEDRTRRERDDEDRRRRNREDEDRRRSSYSSSSDSSNSSSSWSSSDSGGGFSGGDSGGGGSSSDW